MADPTIIEAPVQEGARGALVRLIQEWLCLHDHAVVIDSEFGPATRTALAAFQRGAGLPESGVADAATFSVLVSPLARAMAIPSPNGTSVGDLVVACARRHVAEHPREVGGENRGPWVRFYMKGKQGPEWPWCAGFACTVLAQACAALDRKLPIRASVSCDSLAASARERNCFVAEKQATPARITPGSVFLARRTPTDWSHTGIVVAVAADHFSTIEGNTNDAGDREGYEVCCRTRGYAGKDFIVYS